MKYKHFFSIVLSFGMASSVYALPYSEAVNGEMMLQGGSQSSVSWAAPAPGKSEVYVRIPKDSTAKSATYWIYPNGSTDVGTCSATDAVNPCFEVQVNQLANKDKLVQLKADKVKSWDFSTNGIVSVVASKSVAGEMVGVDDVRFNQVAKTLKYTKISNTGDALPDTATEWNCTRDDNTGLIWEIKTADKGLRDKDNQYSWYDPNPLTNGGHPGLEDGGKDLCSGGIKCNTDAYVKAVNAQALCGFKDWRMPSYHELVTILKPDTFPAIDMSYFPNTEDYRTWTSTTDIAYPDKAWYFYFGNGTASMEKANGATIRVRLVRSGD